MGRGRPGSSILKFSDDGPRPSSQKFDGLGRGPARPIASSSFTARPGPVHNFFHNSRRGPARPITFSKFSARPGPAHHDFQIDPTRSGLDHRPMTSPEKNTSSPYTHVPFSTGQYMVGRLMKIVGPAHIEPVSHGPRCHVMGRVQPRAGPPASTHDKP